MLSMNGYGGKWHNVATPGWPTRSDPILKKREQTHKIPEWSSCLDAIIDAKLLIIWGFCNNLESKIKL